MLKALNLSTGSTGNWKRGQLPKGDILLKIAEYLHTSTDYLLTGNSYHDLTHEERQLIELYQSAPERAKYKILCDFEAIVQKEKEKWNAEQASPDA